jgi:hypothetical protein
MIANIVVSGQRVWMVGGSLPRDEAKGRKWVTTTTLMVVAPTAERAIEVARDHWGPCEIHSVQHRQGIDKALVIAGEALPGGVS